MTSLTKQQDPIKYLTQFKEQMTGLVPDIIRNSYSYDLLLDQLGHRLRNDKSGKLAKCTADSLGKAIKNCCLLGLYPGYGADTAELYFIPYADQASADISYKGLETLLMRTGQIKRIRSEPLWEGDLFEQWDGSDGANFKYVPCGQKEVIIGAFAMAETHGGARYIVHMPASELEAHEKKTRKGQSQSPAWRDWFDRMARKTVLKRLFKDMPRIENDTVVQQAMVIDMENAQIQAQAQSPAAIAERMQ
jgi:recombination protein RecT